MAQSSNLFGFFLEAAKDSGGSTVKRVTTFADDLKTALNATRAAPPGDEEIIPRVLRAVHKLDVPTVSRIVAETGLPLDLVAKALETAQRIGLLTSRRVEDAVAYETTSEGKKLM